MNQPFEDVDKVYNKKLGEVLNFLASKLQLYYSSSRLTLLLTLLDTPDHSGLMTRFRPDIIPLPSRLAKMDSDALSMFSIFNFLADRNIFLLETSLR